jgi:hypothetical protein
MSTPTFEIPPTNKCKDPRYLTTTNNLILPRSSYYNAKVIGGKTGFTTPAGNTLVTYAEYAGLQYITVIMKAPQGTTFKNTSALIEHFAANLMLVDVTDTIDLARAVPTADDTTILVQPQAFTVLCHTHDDYLDYDRVYDLPDRITEPTPAGSKVGVLRFYDNGYLVAEADLLTRSDYRIAPEATTAATSSPVTDENGNTLEPIGSTPPVTLQPGSSTNVQTMSPDQDKGSTFVGLAIKFLLILLCIAIFCALIYGMIVMCSIFLYHKKKNSGSSHSQKLDDLDRPYGKR